MKLNQKYFDKLISIIEKENLSVNILFLSQGKSKNANNYSIKKANLGNETSKEISKMFKNILKKSYNNIDNRRFEEYDASYIEKTDIEFIHGEKLNKIKDITDLFYQKDISLVEIDEKFLKNLKFYVVKISDGNKNIFLIKKYTKSLYLKSSSSLYLFFKKGNFDKLKKDLFNISNKIDCFLFEDFLIIREKSNFERIFDFFEEIKKNANEAIIMIKEEFPFEIDEIDTKKEKWINDKYKMRKLNNIFLKGNLKKIKKDNIEKIIEEKILKKTELDTNSEGKLVLKSTDDWELLNIFDDSYVRSLLTNLNYEASRKKNI